jgi:hypothetical protein
MSFTPVAYLKERHIRCHRESLPSFFSVVDTTKKAIKARSLTRRGRTLPRRRRRIRGSRATPAPAPAPASTSI